MAVDPNLNWETGHCVFVQGQPLNEKASPSLP